MILKLFQNGNDSGTVICQELCRQGYLPQEIVDLDIEYYNQHVDWNTYSGYLLFAKPLAKKMRNSRFVTLLVKPFGLAWAYTMAGKMDGAVKVGSCRKLVGNILLKVGVPYSRWRAKRVKRR